MIGTINNFNAALIRAAVEGIISKEDMVKMRSAIVSLQNRMMNSKQRRLVDYFRDEIDTCINRFLEVINKRRSDKYD